MKLVTKLKIFGAFASILVILLVTEVVWNYYQVSFGLQREKVANELVKETFVLNLLTGDYTQTNGDRAQVQWLAQLQHINRSISMYKTESDAEQSIIKQLTQEQQITLTHFLQLKDASVQSNTQELERRLTGQLSIDTQKIVTLASNLANIDSERVTGIRRTSLVLLIFVTIFSGVSFILIYFLLARSISREIKQLIEGTKIVGRGNLSFRFARKNKDEFGQLASSFNKMTEQLQGLDQAKDEFLALASHELRTPMTAIKGLISMIMQGDYGVLPEKLKRPLINISTSTERQIHLINDLLNVSRLQTGKVDVTLTDFSIGIVMREIIESLRPLAEQKKIKLTVTVAPKVTIHADSNWVKQILNNLIGNALKFTDKGKVAISYKIEPDRLLIMVTDTGIGIEENDQRKLFRKFQQLSSDTSGKPTGSGLGLYISREIARNMGGDVWVEKSTLGQGSSFIFAIPKG